MKQLDENATGEFLANLAEVDFDDAWDRQMEADAKEGNFDFLVREADGACRDGTVRDYPAHNFVAHNMSTITEILVADVDGTLHLPVPKELRQGKVQVVATLDAVPESSEVAAPAGTPLDALKELRKLDGLRAVIPDPREWQWEQRQESPLPGRD